jgi:hypothetical protein
MKATSDLSAYEKCLARLQRDNFGVTLWGYLCVGLFLIAAAISLLGR